MKIKYNNDYLKEGVSDAFRDNSEIETITYKDVVDDGFSKEVRQTNLHRDLIIIDDYVVDYVINSAKEELLPWLWVQDIERYNRKFKDEIRFLSGYYVGEVGKHRAAYSNALETVFINIPRDIFDVFSKDAEDSNRFLNLINDSLAEKYSLDLIHCLVKWLGGINVKTLKAMRTILMLYANGVNINIGGLYNNFAGIINNTIRKAILLPVVSLVDEIFQEITNPLWKWLRDEDGKLATLFLCTPVDEMVNLLRQGMTAVERRLKELIVDYYKVLRLENRYLNLKIDFWFGTKRVCRLSKILDFVIKAVDRGEIVVEDANKFPSFSELQNFMRRYKVGPDFNYSIQDREKNPTPYNSFMDVDKPKRTKTLSGFNIPKHGAN